MFSLKKKSFYGLTPPPPILKIMNTIEVRTPFLKVNFSYKYIFFGQKHINFLNNSYFTVHSYLPLHNDFYLLYSDQQQRVLEKYAAVS